MIQFYKTQDILYIIHDEIIIPKRLVKIIICSVNERH